MNTLPPFDELESSAFEKFIRDLGQWMYQDADFSAGLDRNGRKCNGVDVVGIVDGTVVFGAKCNNDVNFTDDDAKKVSDDLETSARGKDLVSALKMLALGQNYRAPWVTLLNREKAGWMVSDAGLLSMQVFEMPIFESFKLVDRYFPGLREPFLGPAIPSIWRDAEDAYLDDCKGIVHHRCDMRGRQEELKQLVSHVEKPEAILAVVSGEAGAGKSRLLLECARRLDALATVVVYNNLGFFHPYQCEALPQDEECVVIIDDAHRVCDLASVVRGIWQRNAKASIVLGVRSLYKGHVLESLEHESFKPDETLELELGGLNSQGRRSLSDRGLDVAELEKAREFLEVLSLVQPFYDMDAHQLETISTLTRIEKRDVFDVLQECCEMGLVRRVDFSYWKVPYSVGEFVLSKACFDDRQRPTKFLEELAGRLDPVSMANALVNTNFVEFEGADPGRESAAPGAAMWELFRTRL